MGVQNAAEGVKRAEAALAREIAAQDAEAQARLSHLPAAQRELARHTHAQLSAAQDALAATRGRCAALAAEEQAARKDAGRLQKVLDSTVLEGQVQQAAAAAEAAEQAVITGEVRSLLPRRCALVRMHAGCGAGGIRRCRTSWPAVVVFSVVCCMAQHHQGGIATHTAAALNPAST